VSLIELTRGFGPAQQHQVVAAFVDVLRNVLEPKFMAFERMSPQRERANVQMTASA
jgi:hypothetical protein